MSRGDHATAWRSESYHFVVRPTDDTEWPDRNSWPAHSNVRRVWSATAIVVLVTLALVAASHPGPLPGEVPYIRWLQRLGEPVPSLAGFVRTTTGTEGSLVVGVLPGIWLVRRYGQAGARAVLIALLILLVVQPVFKELVDRPRPTATQVEVRAEHTSKSFPSGHSLSTTTIWGTASGLAWRRRRRLLAAGAAVPIMMTGLASGVQGVHWPSDAIAGTLAGVLAATAILHTLQPERPGAGSGISGHET